MATSVIGFGVSSSTGTPWSWATGTSLTGLTVIDTVPAGTLVNSPSLTVNVKLSAPLKFKPGVYVTVALPSTCGKLLRPLSVPLAGPVAILNVNGSISRSDPVSVITMGESSLVITL